MVDLAPDAATNPKKAPPRFAPKLKANTEPGASSAAPADNGIQLGTMSAAQDRQREHQEAQRLLREQRKRAYETGNNQGGSMRGKPGAAEQGFNDPRGFLAPSGNAHQTQGPFSQGPAPRESKSVIMRASSMYGSVSSMGSMSAMRTEGGNFHALKEEKPVVPLQDYCTPDDPYNPCMIHADYYKAAESEVFLAMEGSHSLAEMFQGRIGLLRLPMLMPFEKAPTPKANPAEPVEPAPQAQPTTSPAKSTWDKETRGILGKLQKFSSGRLVLVLNNGMEMELSPAVASKSTCFSQRLLVMDNEYNQAFDLGLVRDQLIAYPDLSRLLIQ